METKVGKYKKRNFFILLALLAMVAIISISAFVNWKNPPKQIYFMNKDELEVAVEKILKSGNTGDIQIRGIQNIAYWPGENPIIEFTISSFGIAPASTYKGFYYSVNGTPEAFQNLDISLKETKNGWSWRAQGDNQGTTSHIEGNWFVFEASF